MALTGNSQSTYIYLRGNTRQICTTFILNLFSSWIAMLTVLLKKQLYVFKWMTTNINYWNLNINVHVCKTLFFPPAKNRIGKLGKYNSYGRVLTIGNNSPSGTQFDQDKYGETLWFEYFLLLSLLFFLFL